MSSSFFVIINILSCGDIILLDGEIPDITILVIKVPNAHSVVVINELVTSSSLHFVNLRFEVVGHVWFIHLYYTEHYGKQTRTYEQVLTLQHTNTCDSSSSQTETVIET